MQVAFVEAASSELILVGGDGREQSAHGKIKGLLGSSGVGSLAEE